MNAEIRFIMSTLEISGKGLWTGARNGNQKDKKY